MRKRILSRVLALVMAASLLSTTAFAASFSDLQNAINGNSTGTQIGDTDHYGYGSVLDSGDYEITAWDTAAEGDTPATRVVNLNADVEFDKSAGDKLNAKNDPTGITIDGSKTGQANVTINMNNHTIDMNPNAIYDDARENGYIEENFVQATTDEDGNKTFKLDDDGNKVQAKRTDLNTGRILKVQNGANVTVDGGDGTGGTFTGGYNYAGGGAVCISDSSVSVKNVNFEGNCSRGKGGAVYVKGNSSTFAMDSGSLSNNRTGWDGGALYAEDSESVKFTDVNISNNCAWQEYEESNDTGDGGGVYLKDVEYAAFTGCTVKENKAIIAGGGISADANRCDIKNTIIEDNFVYGWQWDGGGGGVDVSRSSTLYLLGGNRIKGNFSSSVGGGIHLQYWANLIVEGTGNEIYGNGPSNNGHWCTGSDIYVDEDGSVTGWSNLNQGELKDEKGHSLSGWYDDYCSSWTEGKADSKKELEDGIQHRALWLKFAHNKLYDVKVDFNHDGIAEQTVKANAEMENPTDLVIAEPSREGYKFLGWEPSENVKINNDGTIDSKDGNDIKLTAKWEINRYTATFTDPDGGNTFNPSEVEYNNPFTAPADPTREGYTFDGWTLPDGTPFDFSTPATGNIELVAKWTAVNNGGNGGGDDGDDVNGGGTTIPDIDVPLAGGPGADTTTIADQEVPLAALFTRADAIGYLWEQSGSPEAELSDFPDVPEDHRWAAAIGWAQDAGIALPDEDGNFRPDDLVLRASGEPEGELQEFLNRYAAYAGIELDEGELFIVLEGAADDIIMGADAQVIFDGFFAKLEAALQEKAA